MRGKHIFCLFLILILLFCQCGAKSYGEESYRSGPEPLLDKYHEIKKELEKNSGTVPFHVESSANAHASQVDIYGIIKYPFEMVQNEFLVPTNWCDIVLPHLNVRACTYKKVNDTWLLNIYNVDKSSEPLEDAYQMKFLYRVSVLQPEYFNISLTADEGPSHTKDHLLGFEAIPLETDTTFIHMRYSFGYSAFGYFLMKIFGGSKIGFSISGTDSSGNPVYVGGLRGIVERYVVYYYLAVLAYLDTLKSPPDQRFGKRISQWYDLTAGFKNQLFEMNKEEYFTHKNQDWKSQERLQSELNR
ncbi:MAG: hypothetical protein ABSB95_07800 [Dissulfurispiraceae bacterium]